MLSCTAKRLQGVRPNTLLVGVDIGKKQHACIVMDLRAKVLTRFRFSNSRQGFERLLEKVEVTKREAQAAHLLFGMEPPVTTGGTSPISWMAEATTSAWSTLSL